MKSKSLKKRLLLQVILNLEEVFTGESPKAAKAMRKMMKAAAKSLVKDFLKRRKAIENPKVKSKSKKSALTEKRQKTAKKAIVHKPKKGKVKRLRVANSK